MSLGSVTVNALVSLGLEYADAAVIQRALADFQQGTDAAQVYGDPWDQSQQSPNELLPGLQCPVGMEQDYPPRFEGQASFCCAHTPIQGCL